MNKNTQKALNLFNAFMSFIYVLLGLAVMFTDKFANLVTPPYHYLLGALLLLYGIFRGLRFFNRTQRSTNDE